MKETRKWKSWIVEEFDSSTPETDYHLTKEMGWLHSMSLNAN